LKPKVAVKTDPYDGRLCAIYDGLGICSCSSCIPYIAFSHWKKLISQGSVATCLRCGGIMISHFSAEFLLIVQWRNFEN